MTVFFANELRICGLPKGQQMMFWVGHALHILHLKLGLLLY